MRRPFTYADAMRAGVSAAALRGPRFRALFRGVHIHESVRPHPLVRVEAALLLHPPDAFASHASAGRVHGMPLPTLPDEHVSVFRKQDRRPRPGLKPHVAAPGTPVVTIRGIRTSAPCQTFVELAEQLGLVDLVVVGDWLVRNGRCTPSELRAFCAASRHPGAKRAQRAAAYVRSRVDSVMETRLRLLIVLAGLPEPEVNVEVTDVDGRPLYRFDLCWPDLKILVEYDGRELPCGPRPVGPRHRPSRMARRPRLAAGAGVLAWDLPRPGQDASPGRVRAAVAGRRTPGPPPLARRRRR